MTATGSAYPSVFLATIASLQEVARAASLSDTIRVDRSGGSSRDFFTKQTQFTLDFPTLFWVRL